MTPQEPAKGIMLDKDFGDAKVYTVACDCSDPNHSTSMWIEATSDVEVQDVTLTFYVNTETKWWNLNRFQQIWEILTTGYAKTQSSIILNKQGAVNLANVINKSVKDLSTKL
jgi:hypothetical protein